MKNVLALLSILAMALTFTAATAAGREYNVSAAKDIVYGPILDSSQTPTVLVCGNVWDGQADAPLGPMEILVQKGKIAEMGKKVSRPAGAQVINLVNEMVTPGFIDCHAHLTFDPTNFMGMMSETASQAFVRSLPNTKQVLLNGFTTVCDLATAPQWGFLTIDLKNAINKGLIVGPRMIVAPHAISCTGGHGDFTGVYTPDVWNAMKSYVIADGPDAIQTAVRTEAKGGADWIKVTGTGGFMSPNDDPADPTYIQEEMNILVKTAHDMGKPVAVHAYGDEGIRRAVIAGVDVIEHGNMASPETLKMMEKNGTFMVPTQLALEDGIDNINNSAYWAHQSASYYEKTVKYAPTILASAKNLGNSNVKIAFGTDVGSLPFDQVWKEFPIMVKNGITPLRTLKAATSMAAELLRRPDIGTLAVGKTADIIAMPGNPFQDINVTGKVDFVMKDGKVYI